MSIIQPGLKVLFQGDSITDAGRCYEDHSVFGYGYPFFISSWYKAAFQTSEVEFLNRGVSGNRAIDLVQRWDEDCIQLTPDVVSILIGINDTWRRFDGDDPTTAEDFEDSYRQILTKTKDELDAVIIIIEPFLLPVTEEQKTLWRADLDPKIESARKLAREFEAIYVPMDGLFAAASVNAAPEFWAADGVHPTPAGHAFIAQNWLGAVGAL
jgi:acyl-CoA thioesterase I